MAFTTKKSLLAKVRDGDEISWNDFYNTYRPLILLRGSDMGLTEIEKEELVQLVMLEIYQKDVFNKYYDIERVDELVFRYDAKNGRFRHFFRKIVTNQALNIIRKREQTFDTIDQDVPFFDQTQDEKWDREWRLHLMNMGMDELRERVAPEMFQVFENYALKGNSVKKVADFFDTSVNNVYTIKSRCVDELRNIIKELDGK